MAVLRVRSPSCESCDPSLHSVWRQRLSILAACTNTVVISDHASLAKERLFILAYGRMHRNLSAVPVELAEILHPLLSNGKTPKTGGGGGISNATTVERCFV